MRQILLALLGTMVLASYGTAAPPQFTSVDTVLTDTINEDAQYGVTLTADDPDTEAVTFSLLAPVPTGMSIDSATGAVAWLPTNDEVGVHTVTAAVADSSGEADTLTWTLTVANVNDAPVLDGASPAAAEFYMLNGTDQTFSVTASDVDAGDSITYSFAVDGVEQGTDATYIFAPSAETTAVISYTATDGSADTLTGSWTVHVVAAYPDSVVPAITDVQHRTNGTNDIADDEIVVTFSQDIDDASISGLTAADVFAIDGAGSIINAALATGDVADDNMLTISLAGTDTLPAQTGDILTLVAGTVTSGMQVPCAADTAPVASYRVYMNGTNYLAIMDAMGASGSDDTIIVTDGTFSETIKLQQVFLTAAAGARPVIRYDGTGTKMVSNDHYGVDAAVYGFEFDGSSDSSDTVTNIVADRLIDVYDCVLHDATGRIVSEAGDVIGCEIYNAGTGIYSRTNNVQFMDNYIHDCGTAIGQYKGNNKIIRNNVITGCGTALYMRECTGVMFENNLIYGNTVVMNLFTSYASYGLVYRNNTITMNGRDGLKIRGEWGVTLENNIIAYNGLEDTTSYVDLVCITAPGATEQVTNNVIGTANANAQTLLAMAASTGNKAPDGMLFADPENGDFHLGMLSPATDASDDFSDLEDYDGSQADLGCYGGPYALDTEMPAVLDTAYVVRVDTVDTLFWAESDADDFWTYVIVRASMDSGAVSTDDGELVDTITTRATTKLAVPNNGGKWFYAIQAVDTMGYGGGFGYAVSSVSGEIIVTPGDVVDFGLMEIDSFAFELVALINTGTETLTVSDISLRQGTYVAPSDTNGDSLMLPIMIAPGQGYPVALLSMPDDYITISDTLDIRSDDPDAADTLISLLVVGTVAKPAVSLSSTSIDYGTVDVDSTSSRQYLTIRSSGTGSLVIDTMWYADGTNFYTRENLTNTRTLLPGGSLRLSTYALPTDSGSLLDTLYISTSDPDMPVISCAMSVSGHVGIGLPSAVGITGVAMDIAGNPVSGHLGLVFTIAGSKQLTVDVFDADGVAVHRLADGVYGGSVTLTAQRDLAAGTYFVMVRSGDERMIRKVVVE